MKIGYRYAHAGEVEVPEENLLGLFEPVGEEGLPEALPEKEVILRGLEEPYGSAGLRDLVFRGARVVVAVDDNTRLTPAHKILPEVLRVLEAAGAETEIVVALGTHRRMSGEELERKLGTYVLSRYCDRVFQHDAFDRSSLVYLGRTGQGTEIWVNHRLLRADVVVGVGHVVPHRVAGYSGGGKIIQPGVCGEITTGQTHWLSARFRASEIMGVRENPVRREIDEVARLAGLKFSINAVQDRTERMVGLYCGDVVLAHEEAAKHARTIYGVDIPKKADIVLIDSYPADLEMWQAAKGIYAASLAVRQGGVIVLLTPCPEGVSRSYPEVAEIGYRTYREVEELLARGELTDLTMAAHLVHVGEVIREQATCILVCPGIEDALASRLGFIPASSPREAMEMAFSIAGKDAKVLAFRNGGEVLPLIEETAEP